MSRPVLVVTGSSGFVGRHVVAAAAEQSIDVLTLDRRRIAAGRPDVLVDLARPAAQVDALTSVLARAEAVVHLAGCAGVRWSGAGVEDRRRRDNVLAARTVLELTPSEVPVIVTSSSSVYGGARSGRPSREDDRLRPLGGYAESKVAVEVECSRRARRGGRVTVVRPFTVVGRGQRPDMALARWVAQAASNEPLTVFGALARSRDLTDAGDVARALLVLAERAPQAAVNLGSGRAVVLGDITTAVARRLGDHGLELRPPSPHEPDHTLADVARCHHLVGFVPRSPDLDQTVAALVGNLTSCPVGAV